jgi:xylose isomerase
MDSFARGLEIAHRILEEGVMPEMVKQRYASFDTGEGKKFEEGKSGLEELARLATAYGTEGSTSSKQELFENILNEYMFGA